MPQSQLNHISKRGPRGVWFWLLFCQISIRFGRLSIVLMTFRCFETTRVEQNQDWSSVKIFKRMQMKWCYTSVMTTFGFQCMERIVFCPTGIGYISLMLLTLLLLLGWVTRHWRYLLYYYRDGLHTTDVTYPLKDVVLGSLQIVWELGSDGAIIMNTVHDSAGNLKRRTLCSGTLSPSMEIVWYIDQSYKHPNLTNPISINSPFSTEMCTSRLHDKVITTLGLVLFVGFPVAITKSETYVYGIRQYNRT